MFQKSGEKGSYAADIAGEGPRALKMMGTAEYRELMAFCIHMTANETNLCACETNMKNIDDAAPAAIER